MARGRLALLAVALAGCARHEDTVPGARSIDCLLSGKATTCKVETVIENGVKLLVVRHPDGGFRRFRAVSDGRGVVPADGSESAAGEWTADHRFAVSVRGNRYLFPARELPGHAARH